jgi:hypothetical protein
MHGRAHVEHCHPGARLALAGIEVPRGSRITIEYAVVIDACFIPLLANSDSSPSVMAEHVPAIRSGTSLQQMADWVAGSEEWVAINEKWYSLKPDQRRLCDLYRQWHSHRPQRDPSLPTARRSASIASSATVNLPAPRRIFTGVTLR